MDNNWGYGVPPTQSNHWIPPPPTTRSMKRTLSESDCDDIYSEESSKDQTSPSDSTNSCQLLSRKKRRGVIEKKRRDRINSSLSELKRLVPSAYEKQGSAKLEKAEILQLTVEHLKNLQSKGIDSVSYDPQRFAMDYHIIGFRECAAEVARYLVTMEGMDIQDPLRLRLMSHLQYFVQQREISAKTSSTWSAAPTNAYQSNCTPSAYHQTYSPSTTTSSNTYVPNLPPPVQIYPTIHSNSTSSASSIHHHSLHRSSTSTSSASDTVSLPVQQQSQPAGIQQHEQSPQHHQHHYTNINSEPHHEQEATYIELTSSNNNHRTQSTLNYPAPSEYSTSNAQGYNGNGNLNYTVANNSKPYRPWGAEMAY